ncbi:MAG: PTS lactose/cellobiose transporter subunit IIA [Defluviitaleaceae bacterium]|nr:PTS lactose/cellobiose transporter subunit IIA [Defluviitaleaceae bacterium]
MHSNLEETVVTMIANAGDSRSSSIEAIEYAKGGDFLKARDSLDHSEEALQKAHKAHTQLLAQEAKEGLELSFLIVHATNHVSIADVSKHFATELVFLYEKIMT